jgi:hypothetical protein
MLKKIRADAKNWLKTNKTEGDTQYRKLTMCKKCFTFYYKKGWHFEKPAYLDSDREEEIPVRFTQCPACLEQEVAAYEMEGLVFG